MSRSSRPRGSALRASLALVALARASAGHPSSSAGSLGAPRSVGELTDAHRALFASRTPACEACQLVACHLDETLLPRTFDERARAGGASASSYGRFETMVEEEVSAACRASSIQLRRDVRRACERMLEDHEEAIVDAWYRRVRLDDDDADDPEPNMSWLTCSESAGAARACPDDVAELDVPALDRLEQERKLAGLRRPPDADATFPGSNPVRYQSQPAEPQPPRGSGEVETLVGSDFISRVVAAEKTDALVYFAFPRERPKTHEGAMRTFIAAARAMSSSEASTALVATIDAERNEVPHPYGSHVRGPTVLLYPAGEKHKPKLLPLRETGRDEDDAEAAPTLGDVLALFHRRGGEKWTREAAGEAFVAADAEALEGRGRRRREDDDEL